MNETNLTSQRLGLPIVFQTIVLCLALLVFGQGCGKTEGGKNVDVKSAGAQASSDTKSSDASNAVETQSTPGETANVEQANVEATNTSSGDGNAVADEEKAAAKKSGPEKAELISFDDLNLGMQVDVKFRPIFLKSNQGRVKELLGKRVIVSGYMDPTDSMKGVKEFILLRNLECKFGPGGQADHLVRVYLPEDGTTSFTNKIVYVEGKLVLNPFPADPQSPITWSIYDMEESTVSMRRPR